MAVMTTAPGSLSPLVPSCLPACRCALPGFWALRLSPVVSFHVYLHVLSTQNIRKTAVIFTKDCVSPTFPHKACCFLCVSKPETHLFRQKSAFSITIAAKHQENCGQKRVTPRLPQKKILVFCLFRSLKRFFPGEKCVFNHFSPQNIEKTALFSTKTACLQDFDRGKFLFSMCFEA